MFGKEPQAFEPGLIIAFSNYYAVEADGAPEARLIDERLFDGPIPEMVEHATAEVLASLRKSRGAEGARRHDTREYPREAVREAVPTRWRIATTARTRATCRSRCACTPTAWKIESPGRLVSPVTEANLEWSAPRATPSCWN